MARRKYTREFKVSAVKLVNEQGYSIVEAARNLGVDDRSVRDWVEKFSKEDGLAPTGNGATQTNSAVDESEDQAACLSTRQNAALM
jgi:transposase-like protein